MTARWTAWTLGLMALALAALFPLRLALGIADFERISLSARQVGGTIWSGRIGDLQLGRQPLGTFDVRLDPLVLLLGKASMRFDRIEDAEGPLFGSLHAGGSRRGVRGTTGRIAASALFAPLPVQAVELNDATILFRGGRCAEASGEVRAIIGMQVAGIDLGRGLTGKLACDGERVRLDMVSPSGGERIDFYVSADGRYRAWMQVTASNPAVALGIGLLGFRPAPGGYGLSVEGRL